MTASTAASNAAPGEHLPAFDDAQARDFLELLFADLPGLIELRTFDPMDRAFCRNVNEALAVAEGWTREQRNVYFGVATRRDASSGEKCNLCAVRALWVDSDFHDPGDREAHEVALERIPLPQSMRVWSGGGEHTYWLLEEPLDLTSEDGVSRLECINRGLLDLLDAPVGTHNADRILRIPGTINFPNAKKRAVGRVPAPCFLVQS